MSNLRDRNDYEALQRADARVGTDALLALLHKHHGADIQRPVEHEPEEDASKPAVAEYVPPKLDTWFRLIDATASREPLLIDIKYAVCSYFKLYLHDFDSAVRIRKVTYPRQVGYYLARILTTKSLAQIAAVFGKRDHTTILYGIRKIERLIEVDSKVAYDIEQVKGAL